jgi:hypothetical protein
LATGISDQLATTVNGIDMAPARIRARVCRSARPHRVVVCIPRARWLRTAWFALGTLGAAACTLHVTDSAGNNGGQSGGSATIALSTATTFVTTGQSRTITVTLTRQGYDKPLTLKAYGACSGSIASCQPLPTGVTATFNPATLSGTVLTSTLTLAIDPGAQAGPVPVLIDANNGDFDAPTPLNLTVTLPSVTVTRSGSGTGTVTSNPSGITCGNTCSGQFKLGTSVTLTATAPAGNAFAGWSGGCSGTSATCNVTINAPSTNITATFNSTIPSFALAVTPTLVSIPQGGSGAATVTLTRANGFAGAVNLSVSGAPSGLTVAPSPASVTGDTATLNIAAALSTAAGSYLLTVAASGTGVAQQTATFKVQVTPATGGSSNIAFSFATCDPTQVPIWLAVQNGNGTWAKVAVGTNNTFTFPVGATGGVAYVQQAGTGFSTTVLYGSGTELTAIASGDPCRIEAQTGTKRVNGTTAHISPSPVFATLSIGGADTLYQANTGPNFTLAGVPNGTRDLFAAVHGAANANGFTPLQRLLIRRNINYANNATMPQLDFSGPESFIPPTHRVLINNLGTDQQTVSESFVTANGATATLVENIGATFQPGPGVLYFAVPDSLLQPGDLHAIQVAAAPAGNNPISFRIMLMMLHSATDPTITFGPPLNTPTVTSVAATPYLQPRAQLQSQSAYSGVVDAQFAQSANSVDVAATAAYFGGAPATWTVSVPDLTAAGYDPTWGLKSGTSLDWQVNAFAGDVLVFAGATPFDGAQILGAGRSSSSSAVIGSRPGGLIQWLRRP